jgi:hypothetical protein
MAAGQEGYNFPSARHELCESNEIHELEPARTAMFAGGAHELRADNRPSELPHDQNKNVPLARPVNNDTSPETTQTTNNVVSPHVEAQRRREVEWLENEETRIRQRREQLLQQDKTRTR